ncbi:adenosine deaminase [Streptococcus cuniculi]|uniref:Adenosine deaminase n=1 Tax=Streptococcus cuniculi TaxID=1432788 RepID=A0A1Q8E8L8_9STRE|nr:adenosine deaminase [Streptococcus cuniculi]OLF48132.1 adenosine deaminase [Streptococcus cuniculi]
MDEAQLRRLPKVELHCHLDGSISLDFLKKVYNKTEHDAIKMLADLVIAPDKCQNLTEYLRCFSLLTGALKTEHSLQLAVLDVAQQAIKENIIYMELRFAPEYVANEAMSMEQAVLAVVEGIRLAQSLYKIKIGLILCMMRGKDNQQIVHLASKYYQNGVNGLDLAGNEVKYGFSALDQTLFARAKSEGVPFTIHAGETGSVENVLMAVQLGASRIGHGIALSNSKVATDFIKGFPVTLELCPICNIQTGASPAWSQYPFQSFIDDGIQVTLNTDNRTVSNTSLTKEFLTISHHFNLTKETAKKLVEDAIDAAFVAPDVKQELRRQCAEFDCENE